MKSESGRIRNRVIGLACAAFLLAGSDIRGAIDVDMALNDQGFVSFDHFRAALELNNTGDAVFDAQIFGILEVGGQYFFWPEFTQDVRFGTEDIETGETSIEILDFDFPDIDTFIPFGPMYFWGAWYKTPETYGYDVTEFWLDDAHKWTPTPTPTPVPPTETPAPTLTPTPSSTVTPTQPCTPYPVSGAITNETIWGMTSPSECGEYLVEGDITIHAGGILSIEAGVQVFFSAGTRMIVGGTASDDVGTLFVDGTDDVPVIFTGQTETPGFWSGVRFNPYASADTLLDRCHIRYGGTMTHPGVVIEGSDVTLNVCYVEHSAGTGVQVRQNASPTLTYLVVHDNALHGFHCQNSDPLIRACDIYANEYYGIFIDGALGAYVEDCDIHHNQLSGVKINVSATDASISDTIFTSNNDYAVRCFASDLGAITGLSGNDNLYDLIYAGGDAITDVSIWSPSTFPILIHGEVTVAGVDGETAGLMLQAGLDLSFEATSGMTIGSVSVANPGYLDVNGTVAQPVEIGPDPRETPSPGMWRGIRFLSASVDAQCQIQHAVIEFGGSASSGLIECHAASPSIEFCEFSESAHAGILCDTASSPSIADCVIQGNVTYGIFCSGAGTNPEIIRNEFLFNATAIYCASGSLPVVSGTAETANSFANNSNWAVQNADPATCIPASYNYWGSSNGPDDDLSGVDGCVNAANNNDPGQNVSEDVDYTPWAAAFNRAPAQSSRTRCPPRRN